MDRQVTIIKDQKQFCNFQFYIFNEQLCLIQLNTWKFYRNKSQLVEINISVERYEENSE